MHSFLRGMLRFHNIVWIKQNRRFTGLAPIHTIKKGSSSFHSRGSLSIKNRFLSNFPQFSLIFFYKFRALSDLCLFRKFYKILNWKILGNALFNCLTIKKIDFNKNRNRCCTTTYHMQQCYGVSNYSKVNWKRNGVHKLSHITG